MVLIGIAFKPLAHTYTPFIEYNTFSTAAFKLPYFAVHRNDFSLNTFHSINSPFN